MLLRGLNSPRKQLFLGGAAIFLLAVGLYGRTLSLPLIYDTLLHIRITKELDWGSVWLPATSFGFYRPFTFVPLLLIKGVWGYYPGPLLHGINVLTHAVNGVLLMLLAWRLWNRPVLAALSGLLFVAYPFSYQAVAIYGHNVHPAISNLLLVGLLLYLAARQNWRGRRWLWWGLTALVAVKALLTHESAILFGLLAGLVHIQSDGSGDWLADLRRQLGYLGEASLRFVRTNRPWLLLLSGGIGYFFIYQFLPLSRAPQAAETAGGSLGFKLMYLAQAVAYPLAAPLYRTDWLGPVATVVVAFLAVLLLTFWSGRSAANRWPLFTGWVWFSLAGLLVALPLPTGYLLNGPRLLYLSSLGTALLWPWLLAPLWRRRPWGSLLWLALLLGLAASNVRFVGGRLAAYANLTSPVSLLQAVLAERPTTDGVMLVNLPSWVAPAEKSYPAGAEFVAMMGGYLFAEELVEANVPGANRPVWAGAVRDIQQDPDYGYIVHAQSSTDGLTMAWNPTGAHVIISFFEADGVVPRYTGRYEPAANQANIAQLGPYVLAEASATLCDGAVQLHSTWQPSDSITPTTSLFMQLLGVDGVLLAQADGPPLGLRPDLLAVVAGWQLVDQRSLAVTAGEPTTVLLGAYDYVSGARLPARDGAGAPLADDAYRLPVEICGGK